MREVSYYSINRRLITNFVEDYPAAKKICWYRCAGNYLAIFLVNGKYRAARYDNSYRLAEDFIMLNRLIPEHLIKDDSFIVSINRAYNSLVSRTKDYWISFLQKVA